MTSIGEYLEKPYTTILKRDEDGDFVAQIKEFRGCIAHGQTAVEALTELRPMASLWIESCLADGHPVPPPDTENETPSGKWLQRAPRSLHAALAALAEKEEVSLNQLVVSILAKEVGYCEGVKAVAVSISSSISTVDHAWASLDDVDIRNWQMQGSTGVGASDMFFIDKLLRGSIQTHLSANIVEIGNHGDQKKHKGWN